MGIPSILIAVPIFGLLFAVISKTLQKTPLLGGRADVVLSFCVAAICVISVFRVTPLPTAASARESVAATASEETTEEKSNRPLIEFILLPYAALLLTLPFVWLLKLFTNPKHMVGNTSGRQFSQDHYRPESLSALKERTQKNKFITKPEPIDRTTC
jgi:hypothetical protein